MMSTLSPKPHLAISDWLRKLDLEGYSSVFKKYSGVEDILHLSEKELKSMGIKNGSHRARIATSLHVLKEKYHKAFKNHSPNASLSSLRSDGSGFKSFESISPISHVELENSSSGVRSWPCSGASSLAHTRHSSHRSSMEGINMNANAEDLKKALERELSMDGTDLRSYAWYHGTILRQRAEELVVRDGDFLVRDCISQPGDYVITCRWKGLPLHFIIKKVILNPHTVYEKIQYTFEHDHFDSITDFITYYVGSKCPLSSSSGVVISNPINRCMPLSYYASRYGAQCQVHYAVRALEKIPAERQESEDCSLTSPPRPSQVTTPVKSPPPPAVETVAKQPVNTNGEEVPLMRKLVRVGSDPNLNLHIERKTLENRPNSGSYTTESIKEMSLMVDKNPAPPKPSRVPSKRLAQRPLVVKRERRNTPPTPLLGPLTISIFDDSTQHSVPIPVKRMISGETRFSFLDHPSVSSDGSFTDTVSSSVVFSIPPVPGVSCFTPMEFRSPLIVADNKPLEVEVLSKVRELLFAESPKHLACHLTRVDLEVAKSLGDEDLGLGVTSGLELVLLPQGRQLIKDLLERTNCLKVFVEVTILTCASEEDRVEMLRKWIQVALDTKNSLGNLFGFTAIMLGLTAPEVLCLNSMWFRLRQTSTDEAFTFETKLRPALKSMQEAAFQVAPNTCIPYVLSLLNILEHHLRVMEDLANNNDSSRSAIADDDLFFGIPGEPNSKDYGIQMLADHLEAGRSLFLQSGVYQSNSDMALKNVKCDNLLLDIFRTEFHLRMLWGCRGAIVSSDERYAKFSKILQLLCMRCQNAS